MTTNKNLSLDRDYARDFLLQEVREGNTTIPYTLITPGSPGTPDLAHRVSFYCCGQFVYSDDETATYPVAIHPVPQMDIIGAVAALVCKASLFFPEGIEHSEYEFSTILEIYPRPIQNETEKNTALGAQAWFGTVVLRRRNKE